MGFLKEISQFLKLLSKISAPRKPIKVKFPPKEKSSSEEFFNPKNTPTGKYIWFKYNVPSPHHDPCGLRFSDRLGTCTAISSDIARQFNHLVHCFRYSEITKMVADGVIYPDQRVQEWITSHYSNDDALDIFGYWPNNDSHSLPDLSPAAFILYDYLSILSRKKNYSVENTPQSVKEYLTNGDLLKAYSELEKANLLIKAKNNVWQHSQDALAKQFRESINRLGAVAQFIYRIEGNYKNYTEEILTAGNEKVFVIFKTPERDENLCPACAYYENKTQVIPPLNFVMRPFHYHCGHACPHSVFKEQTSTYIAEHEKFLASLCYD